MNPSVFHTRFLCHHARLNSLASRHGKRRLVGVIIVKNVIKKIYNAMDSEENKLIRAEVNKNGLKNFRMIVPGFLYTFIMFWNATFIPALFLGVMGYARFLFLSFVLSQWLMIQGTRESKISGGSGCFVRFSYFMYVTCCRLALFQTFIPCFRWF